MESLAVSWKPLTIITKRSILDVAGFLWNLDNVKKEGKSKEKNTERTTKLKTIVRV